MSAAVLFYVRKDKNCNIEHLKRCIFWYRVQNIVGKGAISPFPMMFSKVISCRLRHQKTFAPVEVKSGQSAVIVTSPNFGLFYLLSLSHLFIGTFWGICSRRTTFVNPFPHIDAFWHLCSRRLFENMATKVENLLKTSNFSFCHHVFNSIQLLFFHLKGFSVLLPVCFQSRLLQIFGMWERVNIWQM